MYLTIIFLLTLIVPFIVMPAHIKEGIISPYKVVLISILGTTVMATAIFMAAALAGEGIYAQLHEAAKLMSKELASNPIITESFNMAGIEEADRSDMLVEVYDMALMRIPVSIMFLGAIFSYTAYIILSNILKKKYEVIRMPKFREFTFGHGTAMALLMMYIAAWAMMQSELPVGEMVYANINMLFDLIFSLQGIAVVMMFFHFKRIPQILAVLVSGFMWMTPIGKMFLVLMGMADLIIGLRIRMGSKPER